MKNNKILIAFFAMVMSLGCTTNKKQGNDLMAHLYYNGNIITMDTKEPSYAEAIVEQSGKIAFVGTLKEAEKRFSNLNKIDLKGKTLLPGFIDPHSHFGMVSNTMGQVDLNPAPVGTVKNMDNILANLKKYKQEKNIPDGEWIFGWGYDDGELAEKRHPTKKDIDKVLPNNPVYLQHTSGHMGVANSLGLKELKVNAETKNPDGGNIDRFPNTQEPTGLVQETAMYPFVRLMLEKLASKQEEFFETTQQYYASNGITTAQDGMTDRNTIRFFQSQADAGKFKIDLISLAGYSELERNLKDTTLSFKTYKNGFKVQGTKIVADGSPQGKTAYFTKPFLTKVPGCVHDCRGLPSLTQEAINKLFLIAYENDNQLFIHCNGDATVDMIISAHENACAALNQGLDKDRRTIIIHAQFSRPDQLATFIKYNMEPSFFTNHAYFWGDVHVENLGKEITERALERVVQKTSEKRTYKMIKEFEEINKHGFDNRGGDKHITGVYRWVDKIYDNELVNYGKRLVLEMDVPHPAMLYKKAMEWKKKGSEPDPLTPPKTLGELGINKYDDVDEAKALEAADYYGITINGFEEKSETLTTSFQNEVKHVTSTVIDTKEAIAIPSGLVAKNMTIYLSFRYQSLDNTGSFCTVKVNGEDFKRGDFTHSGGKRSDDHTFVKDFSPKVSGAMSFSVAYRKVYDYSGTVIITCVSDPAMYTEWQQETYNQLKKAYQNKLNEYNEELKQQKAEQEAKADQSGNENYSNTALNRLIEERELKRACIELMTKPFCYDMGHSFMNCMTYSCATSCEDDQEISANIPQIVQNEMLEQYARFAKFFETAFQWEIFSYIFYPYYYNEKCRWYELLQTKNPDPIFEAFLQSGMAKILVPVRPQFEKAVMWYIETGEVYTEGDLLIPETDDARYETLLGDLGDQDKVTVEGTWQTRIPSTLTIIQGQTTCYDDTKGLPCDCEGTSPFRLENFILVAKDDKPKDDEVNEDEE